MSVTDARESTVRPSGAPGNVPASGPPADSTGGSVDADNPWLGLASFTEETQGYFFGREGEVAELTRRVQRKLLTVLFGKSGLGKTSILRAGLVPRFRAQGYFPVYLRIDYGHDSPEPAEQIKQAINRAAQGLGTAGSAENDRGALWTQTGVAAAGESIWEFLHHRDDVLKDSSGETLIPLLIFDQFEELFTLAQSDEFGRARAAYFIEELADLVENRPPKALEAKLDSDDTLAERFDFSRSDYRVVIALREDYLAPLESLKKVMPSLSQNRLRLAPMTGNQALEAVLQPGSRLRPAKPLVSEEVGEAIVRFVAGGSELANAEVEPSLLSLICRELNEQRIAQGRTEISQDLLAGSHDTILSTFYERSLADQPESVRRIVEDDLLTESGYRENLAEESLLKRFQAAGSAPDALAKLVNRRLLRIEERLDVRRVELTHDVLTGVVKASRDQRHEREAREATERALADQRAREETAQRALRRTRAVAVGCTLLAVLAFAAAIFALVSFQRARRAELIARQTRAVSEQARQEAEGLLGFLTDDFVNELETFGRYQTIAELSQREINYFQHLPPQLQDPETLRSGALALINHAEAEAEIGDPVTAAKNASDAIGLLERLRRTDESDATALVLGRAYAELGLLLAYQQESAKADIAFQRALDLLRPQAERTRAPLEARRAYLHALVGLAVEDVNSVQEAKALGAARQALRVAEGLGAPKDADVTVDADYAYAQAWLADAQALLGRYDEARRLGEEGLALADQILAQHPQYGEALLTKEVVGQGLSAGALRDESDTVEAVQFATEGEQASLALATIEPGNALYANQLGNSYGLISGSMWQAGRLRAAIAYGQKAMQTYGRRVVGFSYGLTNLSATMSAIASEQAQLGDFTGAAATLAVAKAFFSPSALRKLGPAASTAEARFSAVRTDALAAIAYERGDFAAARHIAHTAIAALKVQGVSKLSAVSTFAGQEGRADYALGDFAAAEQAERMSLGGIHALAKFVAGWYLQRDEAQTAIWLSMALAREGKREEAARTIDPVVTMYRGLMKKNHGSQWLPLEFAEALYAQSLADPQHRAALLRQASGLVDHLIPAIARLHDTRQWRARIEAAQRASSRTASAG
jgi:tetratricopeptide (TPR) repeat protein